jgi:hypothetical protein
MKMSANPVGRPPYEPDEQTRKYVESMSAGGLNQEEIARVVGVCVETLQKYYGDELDTAAIKANAAVAKSLWLQAVGGPGQDWEKVNPTSAIFWAKTRMGWKEPPQDHRGAFVIGNHDLTSLPDDKLSALIEILSLLGQPQPSLTTDA